MSITKKKHYYPPRTFDDDMESFVRLCEEKGWSFSGVDLSQLQEDVANQRAERARHDTLERQYLAEHERFGIAQEDRYQRFAAALNAVRGAFRSDEVVMTEIAGFKRSYKRSRSAATRNEDAA